MVKINRKFKIVGSPVLVRYETKTGNPVIRIRYRWDGGRIRQSTGPVNRLVGDGDSNAKLKKSGKTAYTVGLSLAPSNQAGIGNTCPNASPGCRASCLDETGLGFIWGAIAVARARKTAACYFARRWFLDKLSKELKAAAFNAYQQQKPLAVRLNVFSDVAWERIAPELFSIKAEFYDYTKNPNRVGQLLPNYWVTFSRSERNENAAVRVLENGQNVAVVFSDGNTSTGRKIKSAAGRPVSKLPTTWNGFPVIDGDLTDLRYLDARGCVVGLVLKSPSSAKVAAAENSGFALVQLWGTKK